MKAKLLTSIRGRTISLVSGQIVEGGVDIDPTYLDRLVASGQATPIDEPKPTPKRKSRAKKSES